MQLLRQTSLIIVADTSRIALNQWHMNYLVRSKFGCVIGCNIAIALLHLVSPDNVDGLPAKLPVNGLPFTQRHEN